ARQGAERGLALSTLAESLRTDPLQLEPLLELLARLDWVQCLDEGDQPRHVLLVDPAATPLEPLVRETLWQPGDAGSPAFRRGGLASLTLAEALAA
ncbi:MAG: hypothetical protein ACKO3M_06360, partial [Rubrivivax sp.]